MFNIMVHVLNDTTRHAGRSRRPSVAVGGLSRSEYLRRRLAQELISDPQEVTAEDLSVFAEVFSDLTDPKVMKGAWS